MLRRHPELWDATSADEPPPGCRLSAVLPGYPDADTLEGDTRSDARLLGPHDGLVI